MCVNVCACVHACMCVCACMSVCGVGVCGCVGGGGVRLVIIFSLIHFF